MKRSWWECSCHDSILGLVWGFDLVYTNLRPSFVIVHYCIFSAKEMQVHGHVSLKSGGDVICTQFSVSSMNNTSILRMPLAFGTFGDLWIALRLGSP
jgi:hypothetical protein